MLLQSWRLELPFSYTYAAASFALAGLAAAGRFFGGLDMDVGYNLWPLIALAIAIDLTCRHLESDLVRDIVPSAIYGVMLVALTSIAGLTASYATQRLALPLQDDILESMDHALGFDWSSFVIWVERYPMLAQILNYAYNSMTLQIFMVIGVLAVCRQKRELKIYLAAFACGLLVTILIAMMIPAVKHLANLDTSKYVNVRFTGGVDSVADLLSLRNDQSPILRGGSGLLYFPSFHAVSGVLAFLALRQTILFVANGVLTGLLLIGALTEGAHYACDVLSGILTAVAAYHFASRSIRFEKKSA